MFKTRFIQNATDARNERWNYAHYMFHEKKSCFEYNMKNLKDIGTPMTCIKARNNCVQYGKRESSEANNLQAILYICVGS